MNRRGGGGGEAALSAERPSLPGVTQSPLTAAPAAPSARPTMIKARRDVVLHGTTRARSHSPTREWRTCNVCGGGSEISAGGVGPTGMELGVTLCEGGYLFALLGNTVEGLHDLRKFSRSSEDPRESATL